LLILLLTEKKSSCGGAFAKMGILQGSAFRIENFELYFEKCTFIREVETVNQLILPFSFIVVL
jgi:hypothetical protein